MDKENILRRIREAKEQRLTKLSLSHKFLEESEQLAEIPSEVFELDHLKVLDLSGNALTSVPESISKLQSLTSLNLSNNRLTSLPESISELQALADLNVGGNEFSALSAAISKIPNLISLDAGYNKLGVFPEFVLELQNLKSLSMGGNELSALPESISKLDKLVSLDLSENKLTAIPKISVLETLESLNLNINQLDSLPEMPPQLRDLYLGANRMGVLPNSICSLTDLRTLMLGGNSLLTFPPEMSKLARLERLDAFNNLLGEIPSVIYELTSLVEIDFSNELTGESFNNNAVNKNQVREISSRILQLRNLKKLSLLENPIENPPPEVVTKGVDAIKDYFRQLEAEGKDYLYEAKMLIVGEGGAGKTSLAKKIENPSYELREEDSTKGIEVIPWTFEMENGQPFRVNIWDFGGQEIYHATHQFFLTRRSLYVLVADTRKEDTDFYYWLNVVELLSDNSPLLIISNEKQERQREINERQLRGDFSNLKDTLATNLATNRGLDKILDEVKYYISHLPQVGAPLPKTWVKVREALEQDTRNYISLDEYLSVCEQNGFTEQKDKLQLSGYLHDLGVCLHFHEDPLLKRTVILKPKWGTDAVYKVLDNEKVISSLGEFNRDDLTNIWHEPEYANMQDELLQLMINFKLCYRIPHSDSYIAPQRLTEKQPDYKWDEASNLILRYTYESFMPKGILTQFIVAMHKLIAKQDYVWKSGVILERNQTKAEVVEDYKKREVKIRVAGKQKKELLTIVSYELDNIHGTYKRLKYAKLIPCNCEVCKNTQDPYFYRLGVLQKFIEDRQESIQCQSSYKMVDVVSLIDDVLIRKQVSEEAKLKGDFIFQGPVGRVVIQQAESVANIVQEDNKKAPTVKSAWANGSFYLLTFAVVIAGLGVLARTVPAYTLAAILTAGIIFVPLIGALQLKQDGRLSEKGFLELMKMAIGQLPLIGKLFGRDKGNLS